MTIIMYYNSNLSTNVYIILYDMHDVYDYIQHIKILVIWKYHHTNIIQWLHNHKYSIHRSSLLNKHEKVKLGMSAAVLATLTLSATALGFVSAF